MKFKEYLEEKKASYKCECGWIYKPTSENDGMAFGNRHSDFKCKKCGASKDKFKKVNEEGDMWYCDECGWKGSKSELVQPGNKCPECGAKPPVVHPVKE